MRSFDHGIYYYGENCASKIQAPTTGPNYGFDDERGDYILVTGDHVRFRYEIRNILGRGSFGQVACCVDHKTGQQIALKIIRNKKRFHQQAQVEIRVLAHLRDRDPDGKYGIVRFLDSFVFRSHVCITYELLSMNLFEYIKLSKFRPQPLNLVKKIGASVLISLAFMSRENIVHCDLKPENILLRQPNRTGVKVIDLGSACFENERLYTYIQSRFYRAPEVILGIPYTRKIDLWSFACVLCELAVGYPIFPGESEVDQLACMMEFLGVPPRHLLDEAPRRSVFFDVVDGQYSPKLVPNSRKKIRQPNTKFLHKFLGLEEDHLFVHFISMFFRWDPAERPHAEPAMRHPWICDAYVGVTPKMPNVPGLPPPAGWMNQKAPSSSTTTVPGAGGATAGVLNNNSITSSTTTAANSNTTNNNGKPPSATTARIGDTTSRPVQPQTGHHPHSNNNNNNAFQQSDNSMFPSITTPRTGGPGQIG
jgi:dual specificity tyrosine-phosphorylation-regulated kinase 2/3/4